MRAGSTDWVTYDFDASAVRCLRCGQSVQLALPMPVSVFVAATHAFI